MKATAIQPSRTKQATGHIVIQATKDELENDKSKDETERKWPKSSAAAKLPLTSNGVGDSPPSPATKKTAEEKKLSPKQELKDAIEESSDVLYSATTVFPFTLFPDTVTVDRTKITVCHRSGFRIADIMSMRIEDILHVSATSGPFFGSIHVSNRVFNNKSDQQYDVNYFWRDDAYKLKHIINGYMIALQKEIDCSSLPTEELAEMLEKLGEDELP
jgi:hypothetical protein